MQVSIRQLTAVLLLLLIPALASGCGNKTEISEPLPNIPNEIDKQIAHQEDPSVQIPPPDNTTPAEADHEPKQEGKEPEQHNTQDPRDESSANDPNSLEVSALDKDNAADKTPDPSVGKPETPNSAPFNSANPIVLGISIGESKEFTLKQHGPPVDIFIMDDPFEPVTVHRYPHFLIGFNEQEQVEFIDVTSNQADPGLNGLHLGDSVKDAIRLLGDPDINTDYVIGYRSDRAMLKLDIDPNTGQINSIKLFAAP